MIFIYCIELLARKRNQSDMFCTKMRKSQEKYRNVKTNRNLNIYSDNSSMIIKSWLSFHELNENTNIFIFRILGENPTKAQTENARRGNSLAQEFKSGTIFR